MTWLAVHKQRLAYALVALALAVVAGATAAGGVLLHHAAAIERQALRTQQLGSAAFRLQDIRERAEAERVGGQLTSERQQALAAAADAYRRIRAHGSAEADRLSASYAAYLHASAQAYASAASAHGVVPLAQQHSLERRLAQLEGGIDAEIQREARASRVTNPHARLMLIVAVVAAAILVGLLIWQFEMERRAGRIDRDNARRSEELIRLRDEFVASVSHELRTPLTSILGLPRPDPGQGGGRSDDRGRRVPRDRRPECRSTPPARQRPAPRRRGRGWTLALQTRAVDVGTLAAECVETAKPSADAKQIELALVRDGPAHLAGDPIRLAQMMDNIVSNAIKFTPAHGRVTVMAGSRNGRVLFGVTDTGPGIPETEQSHLFEPFFRTQAAVAQAVKGTGLGLTITKAIVDAHRGSIEVESSPGAGTTFSVELPRGD